MAEVRITPTAEAEYTESLRWYTQHSLMAGRQFEDEFSKAIDAIEANPTRYPRCDDAHRFYLMKRFPFQVIYRKASGDIVLIVAVAHTSRRPGYWANL